MRTRYKTITLIIIFIFLLLLNKYSNNLEEQKVEEIEIPVEEVKAEEKDEFKLKPRENELFVLTNSEREIKLELNECLVEQGRERAKFLFDFGDDFGHYVGGKTPWEFIEKCSDYRFAGENLSKYGKSSLNIHETLMNSKTHRENILSERYSELGIGCYEDVCVQFFLTNN